jgi:hypothetical protein
MIKFRLYLLLIVGALSTTATAQTGNKPCNNYACAYKKAELLFKQASYQKALDNLETAESYLTDSRTKEKAALKQLRRQLFVALEKEKQEALQEFYKAYGDKEQEKREKLNAIEALQRAEDVAKNAQNEKMEAERQIKTVLDAKNNKDDAYKNLEIRNQKNKLALDAVYFYKNRYGLSINKVKNPKAYGQIDEFINTYGFIDKEANVLIPYEYYHAEPFDERTGLARVLHANTSSENAKSYLIDVQNTKYPLWDFRKEGLSYFPFQKIEKHAPLDVEAIDVSEQLLDQTELPKNIWSFRKAKFLFARNNNLKQISSKINLLNQLEILDLSSNQIKKLPESVVQLKSLITLYLGNNQLKNLPDSLANFRLLETLDLSGNKITQLPKSISNLTNLKYLILSGNECVTLPERLSALDNLETLNLSFNKLNTVPSSILGLTNLVNLDISSNQIQFDSAVDFSSLSSLKYLNLSKNKLTKLPTGISALNRLEKLNLSGCDLIELPNNLSSLGAKLKVLNIKDNKFANVPNVLQNFKNLEELHISFNDLSKNIDDIKQLSKLKMLYFNYAFMATEKDRKLIREVLPECKIYYTDF